MKRIDHFWKKHNRFTEILHNENIELSFVNFWREVEIGTKNEYLSDIVQNTFDINVYFVLNAFYLYTN